VFHAQREVFQKSENVTPLSVQYSHNQFAFENAAVCLAAVPLGLGNAVTGFIQHKDRAANTTAIDLHSALSKIFQFFCYISRLKRG
jgi:hypothetical protein